MKQIVWFCYEQRETGMFPCGFTCMVFARNPEGKPAPPYAGQRAVSAPPPRGVGFHRWGHSAVKQPTGFPSTRPSVCDPRAVQTSAHVLGFDLELASVSSLHFAVNRHVATDFLLGALGSQ